MAVQLFRVQYDEIEPYRQFCNGLGVQPPLVDWKQIPPVPAVAFKRWSLTRCREEEAAICFLSSGTGSGERSRHYMDAGALHLYRASLEHGYSRFVEGGNPMPICSLIDPWSDAPDSSLAYMVSTLIETRPAVEIAAQEPFVLFGTAVALYRMDAVKLSNGSKIVETGGFKSTDIEIDRRAFYDQLSERFGTNDIISEYGMSEMASQCYAGPSNLFRNPPWLKTRVIDPISLTEVGLGEMGILTHYDLANWNSVLAIRTEDAAIRRENGFELVGRAAQAEPRGCSYRFA
ncbi:MAG: hypothetical protein HUU60_09775 [Armatimonadetes bacterium]|nr:hypothetical protein [Armatimonadota bacterium]